MAPDSPSAPGTALVGIVDDDADLRRALRRLLFANGLASRTYESGEAFLASQDSVECLVLDIHLGGMSGLELYSVLKERGAAPPVVFITAHDDLAGELARAGQACLVKPFDEQALMAAVGDARRRRR